MGKYWTRVPKVIEKMILSSIWAGSLRLEPSMNSRPPKKKQTKKCCSSTKRPTNRQTNGQTGTCTRPKEYWLWKVFSIFKSSYRTILFHCLFFWFPMTYILWKTDNCFHKILLCTRKNLWRIFRHSSTSYQRINLEKNVSKSLQTKPKGINRFYRFEAKLFMAIPRIE